MRLELVEELVTCGEDDWVHAPEVAWIAQSVGGAKTEAEIRDLSIELIRDVVERGLMTIGDVTRQGFKAWQMPVGDAVVRVRDEWIALGRPPDLGELFWLANTPEGDEWSRRAREGRRLS